jgi:hypothetical protein
LGTKNPAMNRLPGLLALAALTVPGTGWDAAVSGLKGPPLGATTRRPRMNRR